MTERSVDDGDDRERQRDDVVRRLQDLLVELDGKLLKWKVAGSLWSLTITFPDDPDSPLVEEILRQAGFHDVVVRHFRGDASKYEYRLTAEWSERASNEISAIPSVDERTPLTSDKVKVSFRLPSGDVHALRALAARLDTTVTVMLQRAIQDEIFIQERLQTGERVAVVDQDGTTRGIIWR